ncbi:Crp/Fnr family transcriptional regulator [Halomonas saccharevitans]|uniref:Crp/Fnr family transcriptional regulator n=1 Tax=Halomonas saccharevitans TaxID=416872 RepID=A0ABU3NAE8_9GAMM|nr:Crp/Fnr family transcriptional regulator [Halomonas saccharevitans]MDT8878164.1 Crp/Fnr family transcriptional regulator [Halomonas saccharevitans]
MSTAPFFQAAMSRYFALRDDDCRLLEQLERCSVPVGKDRVLWPLGARVQDLFILQSGWACTVRDTCAGERQIIELLLPGDIVGLREFTFRQHGSEARMISEGSVSTFTHQHIVDLVAASTSLAMALFATIGRQEALLTERMLVTLHRSARVQVSHFVLETYLRLSKLQSVDPGHMPFPVSQRLLGQILGLSPVHINRTLTALERDGVLEKHRAHIVIHDPARLRAEADFDDDYLSDRVDGLSTRLTELREGAASSGVSRSGS